MWVAIGVGVLVGPPRGGDTVQASPEPTSVAAARSNLALGPDLCLELVASAVEQAAWPEIVAALRDEAERRPDLFPELTVATDPALGERDRAEAHAAEPPTTVRVGLWGTGGTDPGLGGQRRSRLASATCLSPGATWGARISRDLLRGGADRRASSVELTPGVEADVDVTFFGTEDRVRTWLAFSMPLGIGGTCWVDDVLGIDAASARVTATTQIGQDVTLFGDYACQRFLELMPDGGAGQQVTTLVPAEVSLSAGSSLRLEAASVEVEDEAIVLAGVLLRP